MIVDGPAPPQAPVTDLAAAVSPTLPSAAPPLRAQAADAHARALGHLRSVQQPKGALAGEVVWIPILTRSSAPLRPRPHCGARASKPGSLSAPRIRTPSTA